MLLIVLPNAQPFDVLVQLVELLVQLLLVLLPLVARLNCQNYQKKRNQGAVSLVIVPSQIPSQKPKSHHSHPRSFVSIG